MYSESSLSYDLGVEGVEKKGLQFEDRGDGIAGYV